MSESSVDLPQPLGPTIPSRVCAGIDRSMPSSADHVAEDVADAADHDRGVRRRAGNRGTRRRSGLTDHGTSVRRMLHGNG